jgi:hypothetical protein
MVIFHSSVKVYQRVSLTIVDHSYKMVIFHSLYVYQRATLQLFEAFFITILQQQFIAC